MKTKTFTFRMTTTYHYDYSIEAKNLQDAKEINHKLVDDDDFINHLDHQAMNCWECDRDFDFIDEHYEASDHYDTLTLEDYLTENEFKNYFNEK